MRPTPLRVALLACAAFLTACALIPPRAAPVVQRDLGPLPSVANASRAGPPRPLAAPGTVSAVDWLDNTAIYYRFLYNEPTRVRRYALNRWIAPPSEMLQARLRQLLVEQNTQPEGAELDLRLLRFEQVFDAPGRARAIVETAVSLRTGDEILAEHVFESEVSCAPTVDGAVDGLARASTKVLEHDSDWGAAELAARHRTGRVAHDVTSSRLRRQ
jgi:cholesterol transport system auxiliary component